METGARVTKLNHTLWKLSVEKFQELIITGGHSNTEAPIQFFVLYF